MQPLFPFPLSRNEGLDKQEVQLRSLVSCSCDSLCHFFLLLPLCLLPSIPSPYPTLGRVEGERWRRKETGTKKKEEHNFIFLQAALVHWSVFSQPVAATPGNSFMGCRREREGGVEVARGWGREIDNKSNDNDDKTQ